MPADLVEVHTVAFLDIVGNDCYLVLGTSPLFHAVEGEPWLCGRVVERCDIVAVETAGFLQADEVDNRPFLCVDTGNRDASRTQLYYGFNNRKDFLI